MTDNPDSYITLMDEAETRLLFMCPGCKCGHQFNVKKGPDTQGPVWGWNGSREKPTITPSILVHGTEFTPKGEADFLAWKDHNGPCPEGGFESKPKTCHSFVTDGMIQFLSDCSHALAGQTVPLQPV